MNIYQLIGRNLDVTDAMRSYAEEKLAKLDRVSDQIVDASVVIKWFIDEPLQSIGYELNRYSRTPAIRVEGAAARELKYAVILDADDPESLVAVLAGDPRVTVERRRDEIVIRER